MTKKITYFFVRIPQLFIIFGQNNSISVSNRKISSISLDQPIKFERNQISPRSTLLSVPCSLAHGFTDTVRGVLEPLPSEVAQTTWHDGPWQPCNADTHRASRQRNNEVHHFPSDVVSSSPHPPLHTGTLN